MSEEYVSKDTFNETIKRWEAMNEAHEERTARMIEEIRGEVKEFKAEIRGEQKRLDAKIEGAIDTLTIAVRDIQDTVNDLKSFRYNFINWVIAACGIVITAISVWRAFNG